MHLVMKKQWKLYSQQKIVAHASIVIMIIDMICLISQAPKNRPRLRGRRAHIREMAPILCGITPKRRKYF